MPLPLEPPQVAPPGIAESVPPIAVRTQLAYIDPMVSSPCLPISSTPSCVRILDLTAVSREQMRVRPLLRDRPILPD